MKRFLYHILVFFAFSSGTAFAKSEMGWLYKNHKIFISGMIISGVLTLSLLLWEVVHYFSLRSGSDLEVPVKFNLVEKNAAMLKEEAEENPIKSLIRSQSLSDATQEEGLPTFLKSKDKSSAKPGVTGNATNFMPLESQEDEDPFKVLLRSTESKTVSDNSSPLNKSRVSPRSISSSEYSGQKSQMSIEDDDDDPFKSLLRSTKRSDDEEKGSLFHKSSIGTGRTFKKQSELSFDSHKASKESDEQIFGEESDSFFLDDNMVQEETGDSKRLSLEMPSVSNKSIGGNSLFTRRNSDNSKESSAISNANRITPESLEVSMLTEKKYDNKPELKKNKVSLKLPGSPRKKEVNERLFSSSAEDFSLQKENVIEEISPLNVKKVEPEKSSKKIRLNIPKRGKNFDSDNSSLQPTVDLAKVAREKRAHRSRTDIDKNKKISVLSKNSGVNLEQESPKSKEKSFFYNDKVDNISTSNAVIKTKSERFADINTPSKSKPIKIKAPIKKIDINKRRSNISSRGMFNVSTDISEK